MYVAPWPVEKPPEEVQTGYTGEPTRIISLDSRRKNGGGGGVGIFGGLEKAQVIEKQKR
jgi:hypothetical protein